MIMQKYGPHANLHCRPEIRRFLAAYPRLQNLYFFVQISWFHQHWISLENEEIGFLPYFQRSNITSQPNLPSRVYSDTTPSLLKAESLLLTKHFACCSYQMGDSHVDALKRVDMADGRVAVKRVDETDVYIISRWVDSLTS